MADPRGLRPALPILLGAATMLSLGMGVRQSFGLVMQPMTRDIAITISDFTLAMATQNLAWGIAEHVEGADHAQRLGAQHRVHAACSSAGPAGDGRSWRC